MTNIIVDRNLLEQVLKTLEAGPDVDPIFAGNTEDTLRAVLQESVEEPVATVVARHYIDGTYAGNALNWNSRNGEDDFPVGTKLYTTPPASKMRLIHHVFGEFREPLYQIRKAVMKGNSGEALQLLADLENQMFKI